LPSYQSASDGRSVAISVAAPVALYIAARIFAYLSLFRIAYVAFLFITLRPLLRKYFSPQIDQLYGVVTKFIRAFASPQAQAASPQKPAQASDAKKEM
jgi:uncharacterized membrane protein YdfJ with MMPL/SSD domain